MNQYASLIEPRQTVALLAAAAPRLFDDGAVLTDCTVLHAWRKIWARPWSSQESYLKVCYRLNAALAGGGVAEAIVHGVAAPRGSHALPDPGVEDIVLPLTDLDLVLRRFPSDRALPQLSALADASSARNHMPRALAVEVVSYRPGERCVLRYTAPDAATDEPGAAIYAKAFADDSGRRVALRIVELSRSRAGAEESVLLPQVLGYDVGRRTLWQRGVDGDAPLAALHAGRTFETMQGIGRALAALHGSEVGDAAVATRARLLAESTRKLRKLAIVMPSLAEAADGTAARCEQERRELPAERFVLLHGDAHPRQFLLSGTRTAMFDFDELARGDPEQDLASLIVSLEFAPLPQAVARSAVAALLVAYRRSPGCAPDASTLAWYYRLQLINRAYRDLWRSGEASGAHIALALRRAAARESDAAWSEAAWRRAA